MLFKTCPRLLSVLKQPKVHNQPLLRLLTPLPVIQRRLLSSNNEPNLSSAPKEVYYGVLTPQIRIVKFFSLSSSFMGVIGQPFLYKAIVSMGSVPIIVAAYSFVGFFTVATPLLLHFITKKYVTHLLYKEETDSYVARTYNFFCIPKEMEFKTTDVIVPDVPGMFTSFIAKGKPLFLEPKFFENPHHYARIMGYDKPIDFKLYETPPEKKEKE